MAAPLPLTEQIEAASRMALRCHTHLALWRLTAGVEGQQRHRAVLSDHWEHMRFLQHGQLVTAVVEVNSLFDAHDATINLPHLVQAVEQVKGTQEPMRQALAEAQPVFSSVRILRNTVFAHRTKKNSYDDAFKKAGLIPNQLQELVLTAIKITNELRVETGLEPQAPSPLPAEYYERMLVQLGKK